MLYCRDQITLMKFLGSGAFGEVFEGKAKGISNTTGETKVAIKVSDSILYFFY
jgi:proto-oncogene tyrosine-protein kinase ROS